MEKYSEKEKIEKLSAFFMGKYSKKEKTKKLNDILWENMVEKKR